jgi:hypothetical protein
MQALGLTINFSKTVISEASADFSAAEVAKQLFLNGVSLTPVTPGLLKSLRNPMLISTALSDFCYKLDITESAFPPELLRRLLPRESSFQKALVLLTNPISGPLHGLTTANKGYTADLLQESDRHWRSYNLDEIKETWYHLRLNALASIAESTPVGILVLPSPNGGYEFRADWQLGTHPLEAKVFSSLQIVSELQHAQDILMLLLFDQYDEENEQSLEEVEYLDDPEKPFLARKDRREIQRSSMIIKLMTTVEQELQPID